MSTFIPGKIYIARFKGYKLDKGWSGPMACIVQKRFPFSPLADHLVQILPIERHISYHHSESEDPENFELIRELGPNDPELGKLTDPFKRLPSHMTLRIQNKHEVHA